MWRPSPQAYEAPIRFVQKEGLVGNPIGPQSHLEWLLNESDKDSQLGDRKTGHLIVASPPAGSTRQVVNMNAPSTTSKTKREMAVYALPFGWFRSAVP